jgi:5'-nucleotidase
MGAAIEGCLNGVPSVGFSLLNHSPEAGFKECSKIVRDVFLNLIENGLPQGVCLNVNIPDIAYKDMKGIRVCRQTRGVWREEYDEKKDSQGRTYYWLTGDFHNFEPHAKDTDEWALNNNYVAIVPIETDFTSYEGMKFINNWTYGK